MVDVLMIQKRDGELNKPVAGQQSGQNTRTCAQLGTRGGGQAQKGSLKIRPPSKLHAIIHMPIANLIHTAADRDIDCPDTVDTQNRIGADAGNYAKSTLVDRLLGFE
jgi:hypothetical protein